MKPDYMNGMAELKIVTMAKNGDKTAAEALWLKYRKPMMNVFYPLPMSREERESEAADVFMHYLKNLFDPEREENRKENWTFFSYLYSGMVGRRSKLWREYQCVPYDESEDDPESEPLNAEKVCLSNRDLFFRYNPEQALMLELDREKSNQLKDRIDRIQKIKADFFGSILGRMAQNNNEQAMNHREARDDRRKEV
jgi:hypothetical protein